MRFHIFLFVILFVLVAGCSSKQDAGIGEGVVAPQSSKAPLRSIWDMLPETEEGRENFEKAGKLFDGAHCKDTNVAALFLNRVQEEEEEPHLPSRALLALIASQKGDNRLAFEELTEVIKLQPEPVYYAWRGLVMVRVGMLKAGQNDADYALAQGNVPTAWHVLGALAERKGDKENTCTNYEKACEGGECFAIEDARQRKVCP